MRSSRLLLGTVLYLLAAGVSGRRHPKLLRNSKSIAVKVLLVAAVLPAAAWGHGQTIPGEREIHGVSWFPVGPAPITGLIWAHDNSGRATALAVNPENDREVWVGTAGGGVWHSRDGGTTWQPLAVAAAGPAAGSLAVGDIAVEGCTATESCRRIWVGTGENSLRRDTQHGIGLLVSVVDEFDQLRLVPVNRALLERGSINRIALGPKDALDHLSRYLLVSVSRGVTANATHSTVNAPEPAGRYGIHRFDFSRDGDGNPATGDWTRETVPGTEAALEREAMPSRPPTDLLIDPRDAGRIYAGFLGTGVFFTADDGGRWCPLHPGVADADSRCTPPATATADTLPDFSSTDYDFIRLAQAPTNPDVLYALLGKCGNRFTFSCSTSAGLELYKHEGTDPERGWRRIPFATADDKIHSRYTNVLEVDPRNEDIVYLGLVLSLWRIDTGVPGPPSVSAVSGRSEIHDDHHALAFGATAAGYTVYAASDGGAYRSSLGPAVAPSEAGTWRWTDLNGNLSTVQFHSIGGHAAHGNLIGGTQDNGCIEFDGGRAWQAIPAVQDCGFTFFDVDDPTLRFTTNSFSQPQKDGSPLGDDPCGKITTLDIAAGTVAMYPPFLQDPGDGALYFGTTQLFRSRSSLAERGRCWDAVSPVFNMSTDLSPETDRQIVVTAIRPAAGGRVYVGLYDGSVYFHDSPANDVEPWIQIASPGAAGHPPEAPVTSIAVSPRDRNVVFVAYSGFESDHVWRYDGAGWEPRSGGLGDLPANVLAVERRPGEMEDVLWLGSDAGVHRSFNGGGAWERVDRGLPEVPVYDLVVDQRRGRVYAATHGRGAYVLSEPFLITYEGWVDGDIWDIPVYGHGFPVDGDRCTMEILLTDGTPCTAGRRDVIEGDRRGGEIQVVGDRLTSGSTREWDGSEVIWACFSGSCLGRDGNVPIGSCHRTLPDGSPNKIAEIRVVCDSGAIATAPVGNDCPQLANPPTTAFELAPEEDGRRRARAGDAEGSRSVVLLAAVQSGDGATRTLCEADVPLVAGETDRVFLEAARDAFNSSAECAAATVSAEVQGLGGESRQEDSYERPRLVLDAPGVVGGQLFTAFAAPPGSAAGSCFRVRGLGVPSLGQVMISKVELATAPSGAAGGWLSLTEHSGVGRCSVRVPTSPGDRPEQIAARLAAEFQSGVLDRESCPADENPRDVTQHGEMLITVLARTLEVCTSDPGVGFAVAPEELPVPQLHRPPPSGVGRHRVGLFAGVFFPDGATDLTDAPEIGLRYGYAVRPRLKVEGELGLVFTDLAGDDGILSRLQGQLAFDLAGSPAPIRPFVSLGLGIARFDGAGVSDTTALAFLGAGVLFHWRADLGVRLDGRYVLLDDLLGADAADNFELSLGLSFAF